MGALNPWKDRGEDGNPSDGRAKFGRRARAWFLEAVYAYLTVPTKPGAAPVVEDADTAWAIARRLQLNAPELVYWQPMDRYSGRGFSTGSYQLRLAAILQAVEVIAREMKDAALAKASAHITTLDEWLAADLAGTLPRGAEGGAAKIPAHDREWLAIYAAARRNTITPCATCGMRFKRAHMKRRNCPSCVAKNRERIANGRGALPRTGARRRRNEQ